MPENVKYRMCILHIDKNCSIINRNNFLWIVLWYSLIGTHTSSIFRASRPLWQINPFPSVFFEYFGNIFCHIGGKQTLKWRERRILYQFWHVKFKIIIPSLPDYIRSLPWTPKSFFFHRFCIVYMHLYTCRIEARDDF